MLEQMVTVMEANERRIEITEGKKRKLGFCLEKGKGKKKRSVWKRNESGSFLYTLKGKKNYKITVLPLRRNTWYYILHSL